jgi:general secretion pathway protein I
MRPHLDFLPTRRRRVPAAGAFTLLEVLVSLSIFAFAAVVLGSAYLNILNSYEAVTRGALVGEDYAFARQRVLTEPDPKVLERGGEFETANGRRARWSVELQPTNLPNLFEVAFTCEIDEPGQPEPARLQQRFRVLRPTWVVDAGEQAKIKEEVTARIVEIQGKLQQEQQRR